MMDISNLPPKKEKIVASLLAWFLGVFGAHQFYLGRIGKGILFLLVSITVFGLFITGIAALVDAISLLLMSQLLM